MRRFGIWKTLALALSLSAGAPLAAAAAPATPAPSDVTLVSAADVRASNAKIRLAYTHLAAMWEDAFDEIGARFAAPGLVRYRGAAPTECGPMRANNAGYCVRDNTIYYDELFVAAQAKQAARELGTDGDMAAVGVIAHEVGHAVAMQLGHLSRYTYDNERVADCLGGAFARRAAEHGWLEEGDVEEAFFGMAAAADPTPQLTGDRRVDRAILVRAAVMGHGTREQRTENFGRGLRGGAGACLAHFS